MVEVEKAIDAIAKVIDKSNSEILVVSGALAHEVYNSPRVHNAIQGALKRGVHFDIIVGPKYDKTSTFILKSLRDSICVAPKWPERHFVVGDRRHLRYEPRHDEIDGVPATANMLAFDIPEAAQYLTARFSELKPACESLNQQDKAVA